MKNTAGPGPAGPAAGHVCEQPVLQEHNTTKLEGLSTLDAALLYAEQGWSVLPIESRGKRPAPIAGGHRLNWKPYQQTRATEADIRALWLRCRDPNVAIVCGKISGLGVVDIDDPQAAEADFLAHGGWPVTPTVRTARGNHLYFVYPDDGLPSRKMPWGEIRGNGTYVVAPPSMHQTGAVYTWLISPDEAPLASFPEWLLHRFCMEQPPVQPRAENSLVPVAHRDRYFGAAVRGEVERVVQSPVGSRNSILNRAAFVLGQLIADGYGGPEAETYVRGELFAAACLAGLDCDPNCGLSGIEATITSGLRGGKASPRGNGDNGCDVKSPIPLVQQTADVVTESVTNPGYPAWPYAEDNGRLVLVTEKRGRGGNFSVLTTPIADFTVRIVEEVIAESGERLYRLRGRAIRGGPFQVEIGAEDFASERRLKTTLDAAAGARDPVRAGMSRHLAPAIKLLTGELLRTRRYNRTGWNEDGQFLIPGRELDGVTIQLPRRLPYRMNSNADPAAGCQALESLLRSLAPERLTVALTFVLQAPMALLAGWRNDRYALFISGRTGTLKTSTAQVLMSLYGAGFMQDEALIKWGEGATRNAVMELAASLADVPLLLDNYKPTTGGGASDFVNLLHNVVEGSEKLRLDRSSRPTDSRPVFCWPLITGEDVPDRDPAALARVLIVHFDWSCGEPNPELTLAQNLAPQLVSVGRQWIEWLESTEGITVAQEAGDRSSNRRSEWASYLRQLRPDMINILRVSANLASNEATWWAMTQHRVIGQIIQQYTAAHHRGLLDVAQRMAQCTSSGLEATRFVAAVRQLYASGRLFLLPDRRVCHPDDSVEQSRFVGWADGQGGAFVLPDMLREKIERFLGLDALGYLSSNALYDQLRTLGMLASADSGRNTKVIRVCDDLVRVLHLSTAALREPVDPTIDTV